MRQEIRTITAIILAGGKGTRLQSVVSDRQKVVAEVNGKPFLLCLLERIEASGIINVVICTGYMSETVEYAMSQYTGKLFVRFSRESEPLGTGGAIKNALPLIDTNYCLVMNGDSFVDMDIAAFCRDGIAMADGALIAVSEVEDVSRYGRVVIDADGRISSFEEKGAFAGLGNINAGVYFFKTIGLETYFPAHKCFSLERDIFPAMVAKKHLSAKSIRGSFIDIGTPDAYRECGKILKSEGGDE